MKRPHAITPTDTAPANPLYERAAPIPTRTGAWVALDHIADVAEYYRVMGIDQEPARMAKGSKR